MENRYDGEAFESLLNNFKEDYARNSETYEKRMEDVVRFLSDETEGLKSYGIRHPPISCRLKTAKSAAESIRRRQKERVDRRDLKELVLKRGETWNEYCERWDEADKMNETEPFKNLEEIYAVVSDLAGVRVSLYLPGDVNRVADFLEKRATTLVHIGTHHKTDHDPRVPSLQKRIDDEKRKIEERQQLNGDRHPPADGGVLDARKPKTVFPGYSAYHVIVKVSRDHI
jgi:ppGpp synthetase/RelA/SpoT-type nucleotidyltranferase